MCYWRRADGEWNLVPCVWSVIVHVKEEEVISKGAGRCPALSFAFAVKTQGVTF